MSGFSKLKANADKALEKLKADAEKLKPKYESDDETFWQPTVGKDHNGAAIIRFLPTAPADGDAPPWVRIFRHSFKGPLTGDWYIENCLTTLNKKDPANDLARMLYNTKQDFDEQLAGLYKRKALWISNILVVDDKDKPECNGKVFRYRYGAKVRAKIEGAMAPKIGTPLDPFDFWKGANFNLIITNVGGYRNYDQSRFDFPTPLLGGDDEKLEALWNQEHPLQTFLDPSNFKSYDELKTRLDLVLGNTYDERGSVAGKGTVSGTVSPKLDSAQKPKTPSKPAPTIEETLQGDTFDSPDDEEFFKSLAE